MNLQELYRDHDRAVSAELSFGVGWADRRRMPDPVPTRVAYIAATGELYAHGRDGLVQILAVLPADLCGRCGGVGCGGCFETGRVLRPALELLAGWERHELLPFGFAWLRRRTRGFRPRAVA